MANPKAVPTKQYNSPIGPSSPPKDGVSKTPVGGQSIDPEVFIRKQTGSKTVSGGVSPVIRK